MYRYPGDRHFQPPIAVPLEGFELNITDQQAAQQCMMQMQHQEQEHGRNMLLAIVGTAVVTFLLVEVLT